jgi:predicted amidohydrolase
VIIAGIQLDPVWENPDASIRRVEPLAERAAADGARLVVLPEAFATGFSMRSSAMAEHAPVIRDFLAGLAVRLDVWVLGGYIEPGNDRPVNACSLVSPDGKERSHSRKIHPFSLAGEHLHFEAGDRVPTADVEGLRVTPLICYDLRFVELFRAAADDTDCFVVIANWPEQRSHAWRTLLAARAIDCQAYVLGVNRVGMADGHPHRGDTTLVDPMGAAIATLADRTGVVSGEVDPGDVAQVRTRYPFLRDRRPDVYDRG